MKNNKKLLVISAILIVLIVGASILYTVLGDKFSSSNLTGMGGGANGENTSDGDTESAEDTVGSDSESNSGESSGESSGENSGESKDSGESDSAESSKAPDFTVYDGDGNKVSLSSFFGKPIVLNFWASWCGPCKSEMPEFNEKYLEVSDEFEFLMVNMTDGAQETVARAKAYVEGEKFSFPVFYDTDMSAYFAYGVTSLPTTFFLNSDGEIVAYAMGAIDGETLERGLDMVREDEKQG